MKIIRHTRLFTSQIAFSASQTKSRIETLSRDDRAFEYELCSHLEDNKLSNQKKLLVPMFLFFAVVKL